MTRTLLLLLLSTTALAQTADLRVSITPLPDRIAPGTVITWTATLENAGPNTAQEVRFASHLAGTACFDETLPSVAAGERLSRVCTVAVPVGLGFYRTHATVSAVSLFTTDPDNANNGASEAFDLDTPPDLSGFLGMPRAIDPGLPFQLTVAYANLSRTPATGVTIAVDVPEATEFANLPPHCSTEGTRVTCAIGNVGVSETPWNPYLYFDLQPIAPDASEVPIAASIGIAASEGDAMPANNAFAHTARTYRTFFVTNTNDAESGSLRDAIVESNAACTDAIACKIAFRIAGAAAAWQTIEPLSALPAITGVDVALDGTTQTRYFGDSNPLGPEIELRGSNLEGVTNGIVMAASCNFEVLGLAINSFPNAGLHISPPNCTTGGYYEVSVARNYLGTDPTGTRALPNSRGIYVDRGGGVSISENLVSGNSRAGIFVHRGSSSRIFRNIIGLTPSLEPLGNGAAGVWLGAGGRATDVYWNYIGFNAHAGVALHPDAWQSAVFENSLQANGGLGMDFGHDGVSEEIIDMFTASTLRIPDITNAFYDAARDETVIEGTAQRSGERVTMYLYANDAPDPSGYGEGQYTLGETELDRQTGTFRFVWPGRLPGPWVAATVSRYTILGAKAPRGENVGAGAQTTSSEFSRTVQVQ